jgi:hypothetical protein
MKNINLLIEQVLSDYNFCVEYAEIIEDNDSYVHDNYYGVVSENLMLKLVQVSNQNRNIARFLSAYVVCLSRQEITPNVFDALLSVSGEYRESLLIGLSHCKLSYYQLLNLNQLKIDEALIQLIKIVLKYDCFSEYDLQIVLSPWRSNFPRYIYESLTIKEQEITKRIMQNNV